MLLESLQGQIVIFVGKSDNEFDLQKGDKMILQYADDNMEIFEVCVNGVDQLFSYEEFVSNFKFEKEVLFNYANQPWIEKERQRKQSITFRNRLRYKKQVEFAIGDIITVVYRSEIYSNEPLSYTGELIGLEDDGLWVELDSRGEWFSYCDIDDIVVM